MRNTTGKRNELRKLAAWMAVLLAGAAPLAGQTTLRQAAAARGIPFGAAASADEYGPPDLLKNTNYANLLSTQYDMLEPGNAMKWDVTQPALNTYNFQPGDELVAFAQANGMRVRGHNLCWHTQFPSWLQPYASSSTTTPADMATLLQNHITTEVTHFAGKVFAWDVVNEAFTDTTPSVLGDSIWYDQPGICLLYTSILEVFFATHDPTSLDRQGDDVGVQYRSVIFYHGDVQRHAADQAIRELNTEQIWPAPIVTEVRATETFYRAEDYHRDYFRNHSSQPYCAYVVAPKVRKFREKFAAKLRKEA